MQKNFRHNINKCIASLILLFWGQYSFCQTNLNFEFIPKASGTNLKWSIAGDMKGENPNVLSELIWTDLKLLGVTSKLSLRQNNIFFLSLEYDFGYINSGKVNDLDYLGDNRSIISSSEVFDASRGGYTNLNGMIKYKLLDRDFLILIGIFYEVNNYKLYLNDNLIDLASTYFYNQNGEGIEVDIEQTIFNKLKICFSNRLSINKYHGKANWNLRQEFMQPVSFRHYINTIRYRPKLSFNYIMTNKLNIKLTCEYERFKNLGPGIDKLYYKNGSISNTRLNQVVFSKTSIGIGINYWIK